MPSNWLEIDTKLPTFTGMETPKQQISALHNYLFVLAEQLKYGLRNLDMSNWNKDSLKQFSDETTGDINKGIVQIKKEINDIGNQLSVMNAKLNSLDYSVGEHNRSISGIKTQITNIHSQLETITTNLEGLSSTNETFQTRLTNIESRLTAAEEAIAQLKAGGK